MPQPSRVVVITVIGTTVPRTTRAEWWHLAFEGKVSSDEVQQHVRNALRRFSHVKVFERKKLIAESFRGSDARGSSRPTPKRTVTEKPTSLSGVREERLTPPVRTVTIPPGMDWNTQPAQPDSSHSRSSLLPPPVTLTKKQIHILQFSGPQSPAVERAPATPTPATTPASREKPCPCSGSNENCCLCWGSGFIRDGSTGKPTSTAAPKGTLGIVIPEASALRSRRAAEPTRRNRGQASPSRQSPRQSLSTCPVCGCAIRHSRLSGHLQRVHGRGRSQGTTNSQLPQEDSKSPNTISSPDGASERALDASRDSWWASRDHGRFGSGPSYDDHSEDSEP